MSLDDRLVTEWTKFYDDFSGIKDVWPDRLPGPRLDFDRLLVIPAGMTPNQVYKKMQELFFCEKYDGYKRMSLDRVVAKTERDFPTKTYALRAQDYREPDRRYMGQPISE